MKLRIAAIVIGAIAISLFAFTCSSLQPDTSSPSASAGDMVNYNGEWIPREEYIQIKEGGSLANDTVQLEWAVESDMTLNEVYDLMSHNLKNNTLIYPANDIYQSSNGKWVFIPKLGAAPGDTDALFQVLVTFPQDTSWDDDEGFYFLMFKERVLFDTARFEPSTAWDIQDLLWDDE